MDMSGRMLVRFGVQQIVLQCMADLHLDAVTYATSNIPPMKIDAPEEAPVKGRATWALNTGMWTLFGHHGFPVISAPAGFTTNTYDNQRDANASGGLREVGPVAARLPVGIDFAAPPFGEPMLFRIASAYTRVTKHREPPPDFGPLADGSSPSR